MTSLTTFQLLEGFMVEAGRVGHNTMVRDVVRREVVVVSEHRGGGGHDAGDCGADGDGGRDRAVVQVMEVAGGGRRARHQVL